MAKYFLFVLSLLFVCSAKAQDEIKTYVSKEAAPLRSISIDSTDWSDLEPIGKAIGDSRIVMLGEQDHGDAPTFSAKARLIAYLHQTKGFDVIAFESDLFAGTFGFEQMDKNRENFRQFCKSNLLSYWTLCNSSDALFSQLIPESFNTGHPYIVAGFDNQMYYQYSRLHLASFIDSLARIEKIPMLREDTAYSKLLAAIGILSNTLTCTTQYRSFYEETYNELQHLKASFAGGNSNASIARLLIDNLVSFTDELRNKNDFRTMSNLRDVRMAANLKWLCQERFPNKKIIVWAANYHISRGMGAFRKKAYNNNKTMATEFVKDKVLDRETYSLGFTSFDGEAGRLGSPHFQVGKPGKDGLETWIDPMVDYAFIDFKTFNQRFPSYNNEFEMKSCVSDEKVHKSYAGPWNHIFDGVFFIRHMYPCRFKP